MEVITVLYWAGIHKRDQPKLRGKLTLLHTFLDRVANIDV